VGCLSFREWKKKFPVWDGKGQRQSAPGKTAGRDRQSRNPVAKSKHGAPLILTSP
jgi:hypothetical protein